MRVILLISVLALSGCAAHPEWGPEDTRNQWILQASIAADAYTTSRIQYTPGVEEKGPVARAVLGPQPSTSDTLMYFGTLSITNYLISRSLPPKYRRWWVGSQTVIHGGAAFNNCAKWDLC